MTRPSKKIIVVKEEIDTERLYDDFDTAIKYLKELKDKYPNGSLCEDWWGYEDMSMSVIYTREETDDEFEARLEECLADRIKEEKRKQRKAVEEDLLKKIKELEKKLGELE